MSCFDINQGAHGDNVPRVLTNCTCAGATWLSPGSGVRASPDSGMKLASHLLLAAVKRSGLFSFSSENLFFFRLCVLRQGEV